jgi:hypothetical protein
MKRFFVSIRSIVIVGTVIFAAMCAVSGCNVSKRIPAEQRPSTLDADQQNFRRVLESETK